MAPKESSFLRREVATEAAAWQATQTAAHAKKLKSAESFPSITAYIASLLDDDLSSDVVFQVEQQSMPAHRLVLMRIPYFKALLCGPFAEASTKDDVDGKASISLHDVSMGTLRRVMKFVYTGSVDKAVENLEINDALALVRAADLYDLRGVRQAAVLSLEQSLEHALEAFSAESCDLIAVLQFASQYEFKQVEDIALKGIAQNFKAVAMMPKFLQLAETDASTYKQIAEFMAAAASLSLSSPFLPSKRRKVVSAPPLIEASAVSSRFSFT